MINLILIKKHPEYYKWFAEKEFTWDRTGGDPITQGNRNPLLYKNLGADGIKTGYLAVEKYSLASSLNRNGRRLIAVGSGFESKSSRSKESSKLLTYGLTNFDLVNIAKANSPIYKLDVWQGKQDFVNEYINEDNYKKIKVDFTFLNLVNKKNLHSRLKKRKSLNRYDKFDMSFYNKVQKGFIKLSNLKKKKYQLVNSNLDIKKNEELVLRKIDQLIK